MANGGNFRQRVVDEAAPFDEMEPYVSVSVFACGNARRYLVPVRIKLIATENRRRTEKKNCVSAITTCNHYQ